jgi:hypothetical protein
MELQEKWSDRIESYLWNHGEASWTPAKETEANTWFLFGEKGEDQRVFGVFSSRVGAQDALAKLEHGYHKALAEASPRVATRPKDKGIDR